MESVLISFFLSRHFSKFISKSLLYLQNASQMQCQFPLPPLDWTTAKDLMYSLYLGLSAWLTPGSLPSLLHSEFILNPAVRDSSSIFKHTFTKDLGGLERLCLQKWGSLKLNIRIFCSQNSSAISISWPPIFPHACASFPLPLSIPNSCSYVSFLKIKLKE